MTFIDIEAELSAIPFDGVEADQGYIYDLVDAFVKLPNPRVVVPAIFDFFENNYDKDLGSPGALVHFIESEEDYFDELRSSIERKPTDHTIWMVNRIINSLPEKDKSNWLACLAGVLENPSASSGAKEAANEFLQYQRNET